MDGRLAIIGSTPGARRRGLWRSIAATRPVLYSKALCWLLMGNGALILALCAQHLALAYFPRRRGNVERAHMYAVIKTGGKQYKVAAGEKIKVEHIVADVGQEIVIDQILAIGSGADLKIGSPLVAGALVKATVVAQGKHDKVHIFKMRRRKHYRKSQGHRQTFTELEIAAVTA
jgi:large subunit ribosomal protein L21